MCKWFKHLYMFKILNNLNIWPVKYMIEIYILSSTSPPIWVCHSPCWCGLFIFHGFFRIWPKVTGWGKTSSHLDCDWIGCNLIFNGDVRKLVCDGCRMLMLWNDEKLVSGYWILVLGAGNRKQEWLIAGCISQMNVAGSPSLVGW